MGVRAVQRDPAYMQVEPIPEPCLIDIFVQHRPDSEGAARLVDAFAHALDHRGGYLDLAGILGWAKLQDITIVWKRHRHPVAVRPDEHIKDRAYCDNATYQFR